MTKIAKQQKAKAHLKRLLLTKESVYALDWPSFALLTSLALKLMYAGKTTAHVYPPKSNTN